MNDTQGGPRRLASSWWMLCARGVLAIAFGVLAIVYPASGTHVFLRIFGTFAFLSGLLALLAGLRWHVPETPRWWPTAGQAALGVAAGAVALLEPKLAGFPLALAVSAWAIATGALEVANCRRMRARLAGEIFLGLAGIASITLGVVFLVEPKLPPVLVDIALGCYAAVNGLSLIVIGSRLREVFLTGTGLRR